MTILNVASSARDRRFDGQLALNASVVVPGALSVGDEVLLRHG
jgi:hypothetical protein